MREAELLLAAVEMRRLPAQPRQMERRHLEVDRGATERDAAPELELGAGARALEAHIERVVHEHHVASESLERLAHRRAGYRHVLEQRRIDAQVERRVQAEVGIAAERHPILEHAERRTER